MQFISIVFYFKSSNWIANLCISLFKDTFFYERSDWFDMFGQQSNREHQQRRDQCVSVSNVGIYQFLTKFWCLILTILIIINFTPVLIKHDYFLCSLWSSQKRSRKSDSSWELWSLQKHCVFGNKMAFQFYGRMGWFENIIHRIWCCEWLDNDPGRALTWHSNCTWPYCSQYYLYNFSQIYNLFIKVKSVKFCRN